MGLLVAVEQGHAWVVSREFDVGLRMRIHQDGVLENTMRLLVGYTAQLEDMPVEVDGMVIVAIIF